MSHQVFIWNLFPESIIRRRSGHSLPHLATSFVIRSSSCLPTVSQFLFFLAWSVTYILYHLVQTSCVYKEISPLYLFANAVIPFPFSRRRSQRSSIFPFSSLFLLVHLLFSCSSPKWSFRAAALLTAALWAFAFSFTRVSLPETIPRSYLLFFFPPYSHFSS